MALSDFLATVGRKDLARQNRFEVEVTGPAGFGADREVNLLCESVSMPGQNIRTVEDDLRFGPARDHAQGFTYGDISLTFICTPGMKQKFFFEEWQKLIVSKGNNEWQAKFYNEYIGKILIHQLDKQDNKLYTVKVHEAYPKTINAQEFSLGSTDAYQTVSIDFAYRWWERLVAEEPKPSAPYVPAILKGRHPPLSQLEVGVDYGGLKTVAEREAEGSQWFAGMEQRPDGTWGRKIS